MPNFINLRPFTRESGQSAQRLSVAARRATDRALREALAQALPELSTALRRRVARALPIGQVEDLLRAARQEGP